MSRFLLSFGSIADYTAALLVLTLYAALPALMVSNVSASEEVDLFKVRMSVESESRSNRRAASQEALKILFVRVSGDRKVMTNHPQLKSKVANADQYVASFLYARSKYDGPIAKSPSEREEAFVTRPISLDSLAGISAQDEVLTLHLNFHEEAVTALLKDAGAPYWQANRPGVLIWLVNQSVDGVQIVNSENSPFYSAQLLEQAQVRGIPIVRPLLDLEELNRISADDIWGLSSSIITKASARYDVGAVLVGKLGQSADKTWYGQWLLIYRGQHSLERYRGQDIESFYALGFDLVADKLAADYAIVAGRLHQESLLTIEIKEVTSHAAYVALSEYLQQIAGLDNMQLTHINNDRCYFSFSSASNLNNIRSLIELDRRLVWQGQLASRRLSYRWSFSD